MAQANISVAESQFKCPICLDIWKNPVSIPCGHTYCMACVNGYWDRADAGHYSCPQCRETFSPRPVLRRNTVLAEVVEKLTLNDLVPSSEPEQRARKQTQLLDSQRMLQGRLRNGERELEEFQQSLESLKVSASGVLEESEALFVDLAQRLEKTRGEVRARLEARERAVVGRAEREQEALERELEELRKRDQEMTQLVLTEDHAHFLQAAPLLCVLPATGRRPRAQSLPTEGFTAARRALSHLRARMEELCREEVEKISRAVNESSSACHLSGGECAKAVALSFSPSSLSLQPADQRMRAAFLRCSCRLSLDPDTAHPTLVLLEAPQGAHCGEEPQAYIPHPQRFDSVAQILCREGQFGGASYWEVEWRGGGWVDIGVTYRGIGRKGGGKPCLLGRNENSWRLRCTHAGYAAWHDNRKTTVAAPPCPRIGVFVDRQKGVLSFYGVAETVSLLHTFHCSFSQPLYPAFRLDLDATIVICAHEGNNGNPP